MKIFNVSDFQDKNYCILYFLEENRYSLTETKMIDETAEIMSLVTIKDGGKKYTATLTFVGEYI
jgi:hypothetical protein